MKSQNDQVLKTLAKKPLTARSAILDLNIYRLAARIHDLRDMGHDIQTQMISNNGKRYALYYLMKLGKKA
jgi:hypothetical protein